MFPLRSLLAFSLLLTAQGHAQEENWEYLENEHLRLGILLSHGGAIGYLSAAGSDHNVINHYDHGRLVQQSYYGDQDGSKWAAKDWRYNPVQGGSYTGTAAPVIEHTRLSPVSFYTKTTPRHWASGELLEECVMEQWIELKGPLVQLRYRFQYNGTKFHQPRHQETPAVFVDPDLATLVTYDGDAPWSGATLQRKTPGWPNEPVTLAENWAAYVNAEDWGVGIFVPGVTDATSYRYEGGSGSNCSYVAPLRTFGLAPGLVFEYKAYLTLGKVEEIRQRFSQID